MRFLCVFGVVCELLIADTYPRQPGVDAIHYIFRLTLSDSTDEIKGEAEVELAFTVPGVTSVVLDLTSAAAGKGMTVTSVAVNGVAAKYEHSADRLTIPLSPPSARGEHRRFQVTYHGVPAGGLRIINNKYGERTFFSEDWPNNGRHWRPMIDHPYDKATAEFLITAPAHYQAVANGVLVEQQDLASGMRMTHWRQSAPIASWLYAIGVARFSVRNIGSVSGVPLSVWVYPQDRANGAVTFDKPARQAVAFFSEYVGPFPYEKLANVEAAGVNGGMESATNIFYGERSVTDKPATRLVYHEIAHQWFGNAVTEADWDEVWLSEGFATFFTHLGVEHYDGHDAYIGGLDRAKKTIFELTARLPDTPIIHANLSDMKKVLNRLVYEKGGWTLHMLRTLMGDEQFRTGIREYYRRYRDSNASTEDFRRIMEQHAGQPLGWFFDQWLRRPGLPEVSGGWRYNAGAKKVEVELKQTQTGAAYTLPIDIEVGGKVHSIRFSERTQHFSLDAAEKPERVTLDPNTTTLMKVASFTQQ